MSKIEKMATRIAAEMVEVYLNHNMPLDSELIAEKSCEIAYRIHEKSKEYKHDDDDELTKKDVKKLIKEAIRESQPEIKVSSTHHPA